MFERFTREAREVVVSAQIEARALRHNWLGTEHLLLRVLARPNAPGVAALHRLGVTPEALRTGVEQLIGGGLGPSDADALHTLGIDLDEVRRRVEESFGPGALDLPRPRHRSRLPWRRRRCDDPIGGIPFAPRAKQALQLALRQALAGEDRHIGVEHVLLGLLTPKANTAIDLLRHLSVDPDLARNELLAELDRAA